MIINPLPHFEYLPAEDIEKIHGLSLRLLAELGLEVPPPGGRGHSGGRRGGSG